MAKRVSPRPEWIAAEQVVDIYSVSGCISAGFAEYIPYWKHNGYWLFDTPEDIQQLARENAIELEWTSLFYYEIYEQEFDEDAEEWSSFEPEPSFPTRVIVPPQRVIVLAPPFTSVCVRSACRAGSGNWNNCPLAAWPISLIAVRWTVCCSANWRTMTSRFPSVSP